MGFKTHSRVCLKTAFCKMCFTICGRYVPYKGGVAGYGNRIWGRYTAKWGIQIAGMGFQTPSRLSQLTGRFGTFSIYQVLLKLIELLGAECENGRGG